MSRRKEPAIPNELLDQLLAGSDAGSALPQGGLLDALKKALTERAPNAEMDHHLAREDGAGNSRDGYGRKTITTDTYRSPARAVSCSSTSSASSTSRLQSSSRRTWPLVSGRLSSATPR